MNELLDGSVIPDEKENGNDSNNIFYEDNLRYCAYNNVDKQDEYKKYRQRKHISNVATGVRPVTCADVDDRGTRATLYLYLGFLNERTAYYYLL